MKIYLAGGMPVMRIKGRERELSQKFRTWKRVFSFYFIFELHKSDILKIKQDENLPKK